MPLETKCGIVASTTGKKTVYDWVNRDETY